MKLLVFDHRVDVNVEGDMYHTPTVRSAFYSRLKVLKWLIASGRDLDPMADNPDAPYTVFGAANQGEYENDDDDEDDEDDKNEDLEPLLRRLQTNSAQTRSEVCVEMGLFPRVRLRPRRLPLRRSPDPEDRRRRGLGHHPTLLFHRQPPPYGAAGGTLPPGL